jgi:hypothetical protein
MTRGGHGNLLHHLVGADEQGSGTVGAKARCGEQLDGNIHIGLLRWQLCRSGARAIGRLSAIPASADAHSPRDLPVTLPVGALVDDRRVVHRRLNPPRSVDSPRTDAVLAR